MKKIFVITFSFLIILFLFYIKLTSKKNPIPVEQIMVFPSKNINEQKSLIATQTPEETSTSSLKNKTISFTKIKKSYPKKKRSLKKRKHSNRKKIYINK